MKLNPADINPVRNMSIPQFADWFQAGFEDIASCDPNRLKVAFAPLHLIITMQQSIMDDLESVYYALNDSVSQRNFRGGFSEAFDRLAIQACQTEALRSMLVLAQRINAHELITHIAPMLLNTGSCAHDPSLFKNAFDYLAMMTPLPAAKEVILTLVTSGRFDPNFSIYAFIALCRCDPVSWIEHLKILRSYIAKVNANRTSKNKLLTAKRFISLVPLSNIAKEILNLEDIWLLESLVTGSEPLLIVSEDEDCWLLSRRSDTKLLIEISDVENPNPEIVRLLRHAKNQRASDELMEAINCKNPHTDETIIKLIKKWLDLGASQRPYAYA